MVKKLNTIEAAEYLRLSPNTLSTFRSRGGGPRYIKRGNLVFYTTNDLDNWDSDRSEIRTSTSEDI